MARNLRDLAKDLRAISVSASSVGNETAKAAALAIITDLANVTPVDTSKAISNWRISLNYPGALAVPPFVPGKKGSSQSESAKATIDAAKLVLAAKKPGDTIWISNVLPYIGLLNDGSSTQTPAGFVDRAILIGRKLTENIQVIK